MLSPKYPEVCHFNVVVLQKTAKLQRTCTVTVLPLFVDVLLPFWQSIEKNIVSDYKRIMKYQQNYTRGASLTTNCMQIYLVRHKKVFLLAHISWATLHQNTTVQPQSSSMTTLAGPQKPVCLCHLPAPAHRETTDNMTSLYRGFVRLESPWKQNKL